MENITIAIFLDTRKAKINNKYPVKMRITHHRAQKYYPTYIDLTKDEFEECMSQKPPKVLKEARLKLDTFKIRMQEIIANLPDFSFSALESKMKKPNSDSRNVYDAFETIIEKMRDEGRIGNAISYECSMHSLQGFSKKLDFSDITPDFLYKYEAWMLKQNKTLTTIGIYLRPLRALYNTALSNGKVSQESYPFGKNKYIIPTGENVKKALSLSNILAIQKYKTDPANPSEGRARDLFLFSYLSNGINFKDLALLKYKNIHGDTMIFERAKTNRSNRSKPKTIRVHLLPELKAIIKTHGNTDTHPDNYIFPILTVNNTPIEIMKRVQQLIKTTNKYLKRISQELKLDIPVTTYYARHSYATILRNSGAPVEFISEGLGHSSVKTTANYLDSFESETLKQMAQKLLPTHSTE